ncbi:hypothetical protein E4T56_gene10150 [Termitomyces sp. T112]|nr:hypothetical protein E4T56_gene10150 [Termitomyces sp. T112]
MLPIIGPWIQTKLSTLLPSVSGYSQACTAPWSTPLMALSAPPNSAYLPLAYYYAYPHPAAPLIPPEQPGNYPSPQLQPPVQDLPSLKQQWVKAYIQQHNKVLYSTSPLPSLQDILMPSLSALGITTLLEL